MTELEKTLTMRINHVLFSFKALARDQRENVSADTAPYTKRRLEYCAEEIEQTLKRVLNELPSIEWIEVD